MNYNPRGMGWLLRCTLRSRMLPMIQFHLFNSGCYELPLHGTQSIDASPQSSTCFRRNIPSGDISYMTYTDLSRYSKYDRWFQGGGNRCYGSSRTSSGVRLPRWRHTSCCLLPIQGIGSHALKRGHISGGWLRHRGQRGEDMTPRAGAASKGYEKLSNQMSITLKTREW